MKKLLKIIIILTISFTFLPSFVYTQEDVREELNSIEAERNQRIEQELLLNLPEISDNPNHIITFKDPSGKGVSLEIDGQGFEEIQSPYTLPSLGLGKHILTFKFSDKQETEQTLERTFTIIPRPPVINPPNIVDNEIEISGTSISNSKVEIFLSRGISNQNILVEANENGEWEHLFTEDIEEGVYTVIATTRRNGFASYNSEPIVFTVGQEMPTANPAGTSTQDSSFTFRNFKLSDYKNLYQTLQTNTDALILLIAIFLIGAFSSWILISIVHRITQRKSKKVLQELLKKKNLSQESSFKEKFEKEKNNKEKPPKEEEKEVEGKEDVKEEPEEKKEEEEEEKKETKEEEAEGKEEESEEEAKKLTKEEFLKNFKEFDPDEDDGKEKKVKKNIKISLTSKD